MPAERVEKDDKRKIELRTAPRENLISAQRSSAGTAGAAVSVETGWRVKVTESMADRAAPAVVQPRLVRLWFVSVAGHGVYAGG